MSSRSRALALAACFALASAPLACGNNSEGASTPSSSSASLEGRWVSEGCEGGGSTHFTRDFTITKTDWSLAFTLYADAACTQKLGVVDLGGPYEVGAESARVPGAREGRFAFAKRTVTPLADGFAKMLDGSGCGVAPWKVGAGQDLLASGCAPLGAHPLAKCPADHDVVKRDGDRVFFGERPADNDMCTPDKRPVALGTAPVVKR